MILVLLVNTRKGAGAVAMLITENPRLLAFDTKIASTIIKNEYDFYRPFGKETPLVNGNYSNLLYLIQVKKAFDSYKEKAIRTGLIRLLTENQLLTILIYLVYICRTEKWARRLWRTFLGTNGAIFHDGTHYKRDRNERASTK